MLKLIIYENKISILQNGRSIEPILPTIEKNCEKNVFGIYGVVKYRDSKALILITKAEIATSIEKNNVFEIKKVEPLFLTKSSYNKNLKSICKEFFKTPGLYFSKYNIWSSPKDSSVDSFLFNKNCLQNLVYEIDRSQKIEASSSSDGIEKIDRWPIVRCIQGYVGKYKNLIVLGRRCRLNAGARFFSRGSDANGHPSNFVEIEQFFENKRLETSYLQIRGSVPLLWRQEVGFKYTPPIIIDKNRKDVFLKSDRILNDLYNKKVFYLNLIHEPGIEEELSRVFSKILFKNKKEFLSFGFRSQIKNKNPDIGEMEFQQDKNALVQKKIYRTNCIDCLDRTNMMQFFIGREALLTQLNFLNIICNDDLNALLQKGWNNVLFSNKQQYALSFFKNDVVVKEYFENYRRLFLELGNALSFQYSGTPALSAHSIGVENGFADSILDLYKSLKRYYINRYKHGVLNDSYKIILGTYKKGFLKQGTSFFWIFYIFSLFLFLILKYLSKKFRFNGLCKYYVFLILAAIFLQHSTINYPSID